MKYVALVVFVFFVFACFVTYAQSEWTGVYRDPERVVSAISANPRAAALWLQSNISQAKCRDFESAICPSLSKSDKAKAARAARVDAERAGASADVLSAIDGVIAIADSAVNAEASAGK